MDVRPHDEHVPGGHDERDGAVFVERADPHLDLHLRHDASTAIAAAGSLASVDGPLAGTGDTVSYTYDTNGYVNTVTNEVGHVTTVNTKNARGQPTQITDANGVVTNLSYDFQGRLLTVTVNPGASRP